MATAQLAPIAKDFKVDGVPVSILGLTLPALTFALIDRPRAQRADAGRSSAGCPTISAARTRCSSPSCSKASASTRCCTSAANPFLFVHPVRPGVLRLGRDLFAVPGDLHRHLRHGSSRPRTTACCTRRRARRRCWCRLPTCSTTATGKAGTRCSSSRQSSTSSPPSWRSSCCEPMRIRQMAKAEIPTLASSARPEFWLVRAARLASSAATRIEPAHAACRRCAAAAASGILYTSHEQSRSLRAPPNRAAPPVPKRAMRWRSRPALAAHRRRPASFKDRAYAALKDVIVSMDVYRSRAEIRLDERQLAQDLGISRTPVREAMAQLEREGFVRSVPRRGIYVVRKTKREVIEMITAWAALESMAARLITQSAQRRRDRVAAHDVRHVRERRAARQARRIFRGQYRVSPDHHPHEPQRRADRRSPRICSPICA